MHDSRVDVAEVVYRFAYGIDQRDWVSYRTIFVPPPAEIAFDYSSYNGRPPSTMGVDAWIGIVTPLFTGLDATQHTMSNALVEIDGAEARCRMYMQAAHFLWRDDLEAHTGSADPEFTIGGYYDDHLVQDDDDRWRIDAVQLTVWWRRGNEAIMKLATDTTNMTPGTGVIGAPR
ncbi:MAG: nuclear transport factor 2 family protein [Ilumatobacter sp.]|nr:nuclear transport factor 2 family protein [bacterium]MDG1266810.1 nuclear transport factor 2 family protein [Ilumatobacter sp.]MDG2040247.1 nuclear transport factor 2 family protein [Ilumatobacter sp.]